MTDKKPNNNDIIKALDICSKSTNGCSHSKYTCEDCYLNGQPMCSSVLLQDAIDLHTRQQAELENLKVENQSLRSAANSLKMHYEEAQAEIEKLKECPKCVYENDGEITEYCVQGPCSNFKTVEQVKAEAYKEFAERLEKKAVYSGLVNADIVYKVEIDNIFKNWRNNSDE